MAARAAWAVWAEWTCKSAGRCLTPALANRQARPETHSHPESPAQAGLSFWAPRESITHKSGVTTLDTLCDARRARVGSSTGGEYSRRVDLSSTNVGASVARDAQEAGEPMDAPATPPRGALRALAATILSFAPLTASLAANDVLDPATRL